MNLLDPTWWLSILGAFATIGVLAIIFAETGLLLGFFLPGDSLLVAAGIFSSAEVAKGIPGLEPLSLPVLLIGTPLCAIAGAQLGHLLGARYGRRLFDKPDSRLFKREHVLQAEEFFGKFGEARAVVLARFVPIVRTFMNPVAGVLGMRPKRFLTWNAVGAVLWTESMILLGNVLGHQVDPKEIDRYILPGVFLIVLISVIPIVVEVVKKRRAAKAAPVPTGRHHRVPTDAD
ncbi:membrane-associated protein [Nonomuraea maritima]|uniref:Membrane-associated protein n=2 Tax=Nonomuraea maritima TaxID=683260 RepID=A0A1G9RXX5_9ACTN|nr:DedA family protein [Nonomuraea maritima]SDM28063.1 membrane-associated protein [Nonomuraea maritima]